MKNLILKMLVGSIVKDVTKEVLSEWLVKFKDLGLLKTEEGLDYLERLIIKSENKVDDKLLPVFNTFRAALGLPPDDDDNIPDSK